MRGSSSISGRAWALSALCLQIFAGLGPDLGYGLFGLLQPSLLDRSDLLSFYGPPGHSATSGAEEGGAGGEEPSGLHRAIVTARPSWQVVPNAAALWWSGKPLRGVVVGLKDRFSFGLKLHPALLGLREVLPGVFARLTGMVCGRRAGAPRGGHHIIRILLVAEDQHQAPIIEADLLGQWVARDFLECQKRLYGIDALRFGAFAYQFPGLSGRAFDLHDCFHLYTHPLL